MSTSESDTPTRRFPAGGISLEDRLERIESMCEQILNEGKQTTKQLSEMEKQVALVQSRLDLHDKILWGVCSAVGLAVLGAVLAKVVH